MMYEIFTCRHCGYEAYYLEAMLKHQVEHHPKPETANDKAQGAGGGPIAGGSPGAAG